MADKSNRSLCGLILAAGKSSRMGFPKLNLPWKNSTVLGAVITNLYAGGINRIFIVVNPLRIPEIPSNLPDVEITWVENPKAETDEMLVSIQTGIKSLPEDVEYIFICLGDQPTIQPEVVKQLVMKAVAGNDKLIIPSYRMRRGHPWVVGRDLWPDILALEKEDTVRTFINQHEKEIHYDLFDMELPADMDTPEEYRQLLDKSGKDN
jgi:molybdenum cofactor cytidylyltransferase